MSLSCGTLLQQPQGANAPGFTSSLFPQMPLLSGNTWPQCLQVKIGRHSKLPHVTTGHQQMLEIGALSSSGGWPSATRTTQRAPEAQGPGSDSDTNPYVSPPPPPRPQCYLPGDCTGLHNAVPAHAPFPPASDTKAKSRLSLVFLTNWL